MVLALLSALCWGLFDLARKFLSGSAPPGVLAFAILVGQVPLFATMVWWEGSMAIDGAYWLPGLSNILLNSIANVLFLHALQVGHYGTSLPMLGLTPVLAALQFALTSGNPISSSELFGGLLVVGGAGCLLLYGASNANRGVLQGCLTMGMVAALWSFCVVLDKQCLTHTTVSLHGLLQFFGAAIALLLYVIAKGQGQHLRRATHSPALLLVAIGGATFAIVLQYLALKDVDPGYFETIKRALGMTMAIVLGRLIFREELHGLKLAAIPLLVWGVFTVTV